MVVEKEGKNMASFKTAIGNRWGCGSMGKLREFLSA